MCFQAEPAASWLAQGGTDRRLAYCGRVAQLGEHLLCKRVRFFQLLIPCSAFLMFPTISGNLFLARSKSEYLNYLGFWYGKSTFSLIFTISAHLLLRHASDVESLRTRFGSLP
jgi:hypothetical protein